MAADFAGLDVFWNKTAAQIREQQYKALGRKNVRLVETNRFLLNECRTDVNSCVSKYDESATPLYLVYCEG